MGLVAHEPRLIATAPTTPIAYKSANLSTSERMSNTTTGTAVAAINGKTGMPQPLSRPKAAGSSRSRDIMNWMLTRSVMAVLAADNKSSANTIDAPAANVGPT